MKSDCFLSEKFNVTSNTQSNLDPRSSTLTSGVPGVFVRDVKMIGDIVYTYIRSENLDLESNIELYSNKRAVCVFDDVTYFFTLMPRIAQSSKSSTAEYHASHLEFHEIENSKVIQSCFLTKDFLARIQVSFDVRDDRY